MPLSSSKSIPYCRSEIKPFLPSGDWEQIRPMVEVGSPEGPASSAPTLSSFLSSVGGQDFPETLWKPWLAHNTSRYMLRHDWSLSRCVPVVCGIRELLHQTFKGTGEEEAFPCIPLVAFSVDLTWKEQKLLFLWWATLGNNLLNCHYQRLWSQHKLVFCLTSLVYFRMRVTIKFSHSLLSGIPHEGCHTKFIKVWFCVSSFSKMKSVCICVGKRLVMLPEQLVPIIPLEKNASHQSPSLTPLLLSSENL